MTEIFQNNYQLQEKHQQQQQKHDIFINNYNTIEQGQTACRSETNKETDKPNRHRNNKNLYKNRRNKYTYERRAESLQYRKIAVL